MLRFRQFLEYLEEALTAKQEAKVNSWVKSMKGNLPANRITGHLPFDENGRLTIPLEQSEKSESDFASPEVRDHLSKKGFTPISSTHAERRYKTTIPAGPRAGEEIDKVDTQKIGSLLSDNPELQQSHALAGAKAGSKAKNLKIIITRNPVDVAGQSTGRGWTSCKAMGDEDSQDPKCRAGGMHQDYIEKDIKKNGTHVAYLVNHDDDDIENPIARIALNPFVSASGGHTILRPPTESSTSDKIKQYGSGNEDFANTIRKWAETSTPMNSREEFYQIHPHAYDDTNLNDPKTKSTMFNPDLDEEGIHNVIKKRSPETIKQVLKSPNTNQSHVMAAIGHKDVNVQVHGLAHPLAPPEELDRAMSGMDYRKHEAVLRNTNATDAHVKRGLFHFVPEVRATAINHKKAKYEDLQQVAAEPNLSPYLRGQVDKRLKRMETASKILGMRNK